MQARDIMTTNVVCVSHDTVLDEVARLLVTHGISAVPVVDATGRLIGIVSESDLLRGHGKPTGRRRRPKWLSVLARNPEKRAHELVEGAGRTAMDVMAHDVFAVTPDTPLPEIARVLERFRVKRVPVIEDGKVVGIISRTDVLHGLMAGETAPAASAEDRRIRDRVSRALAESGAPHETVNVVVSGGVVYLWGAVETEDDRAAVRAAVQGVPGCERVEDNLGLLS